MQQIALPPGALFLVMMIKGQSVSAKENLRDNAWPPSPQGEGPRVRWEQERWQAQTPSRSKSRLLRSLQWQCKLLCFLQWQLKAKGFSAKDEYRADARPPSPQGEGPRVRSKQERWQVQTGRSSKFRLLRSLQWRCKLLCSSEKLNKAIQVQVSDTTMLIKDGMLVTKKIKQQSPVL